ncbi:hypothetical protein L596_023053 [Steinernema carpocapsae]|uniref:G-protein coupled receptors family 1 profile domain-containing protein n=1 Tax=Steinernema carpocapsae TaxID=34508 RepID=A0A4U5MCG4_STECR|nr:hypothetical protein L596_023053 [Steinernema carpocapsae]
MTGLGLLLNSIDRLIVISFPLSYFNYNTKIVLILNAIALVVNTSIILAAIFASVNSVSPINRVSVFCNHGEILSKPMHILLSIARTMFAVLAVVIMFVVLIILVKQNHVRTKQAFQSNDSIKRFKIRQMNYTKTMLISCVATISKP